MTNTYAINCTRGKEFEVEQALKDLGLSNVWVPRQRCSKWIRKANRYDRYDRPYVSKLIFAVIPAIYFRDVRAIKEIIGKPVELSELDIRGDQQHNRPGLAEFRKRVDQKYERDKQVEAIQDACADYVCPFDPGQVLEITAGPFTGFSGAFRQIKAREPQNIRVCAEIEIFGQRSVIEVSPHEVKGA